MIMSCAPHGLRPTDVRPYFYQAEAIQAIRKRFAEGDRSTLLVLPTGCVSASTNIGLNRAGKGYSRTIGRAFGAQFDPRYDASIPTMVRSMTADDRVGLNPTQSILSSGDKFTCLLSLADGKTLRATPDHEVMTTNGWTPLGDLKRGEQVLCEGEAEPNRPRKTKTHYLMVQGLRFHPFAMGVTSRSRTGRKAEGRLYRVPMHRLVVEAGLNDLDINDFINACRTDADWCQQLQFIDPEIYAVHHIDRNPLNNHPANLELLTHSDHHALHGREDKLQNFGVGLIRATRVSDVQSYGVEPTFDVVCHDPHRNFVANGIVVHNCGKTVTFGMLARSVAQQGLRTLVLAHRGELIEQATETLTRLGMDVDIEKASSFALGLFEPHAVVATVQTMQGKRLKTWDQAYFDLIITDEAHHATADTYRNIYKHFDAKHLGVTATADRADEDCLGSVFDSVAYEYSLWDAMTAPEPGPYLSRLRFVQCDLGIDLRDIRTTGGDLNAGDLEEAIKPYIEPLANAIRQEIGERKTIVFTPDVGSAMAMATALQSIGIEARWVAGDSDDRTELIKDFKKSAFQVLCNCALLTEGFDCADVEAIALCRPTKSRSLYSQMAGRGTRLAPGKTDCLLIDFNWLTTKHKLVRPVELFDTTVTDSEELEIAEELLKKGKGLDLKEVIEEAKEEKKRRTELRVKAFAREMRYRKVEYDPLNALEVLGVPIRKEADSNVGTITEGQRRTLEKFKVEGLETCSRRRASLLLDQLITRAKQGLATHKQIAHLIRNDVPPDVARNMTIREASDHLDKLWGKARA